jgi:hypothetical protein
VEGHELSVLKGAENLSSTHHPTLIIEIEQRHHKTTNIESVFESFKSKRIPMLLLFKKTIATILLR